MTAIAADTQPRDPSGAQPRDPFGAQPRDAAAVTKHNLRRLLPILVAVYVVSFLDRTNIALAKPALHADLGISAAAYGVGAGLFFLTYATFEVPSNLLLHRLGARFWITRIMVTWGIISAMMALAQGPTSFYALRLLLGLAEAGLFPGVMLYLTSWFGREERAQAGGLFLLGVALANVIGGPLGGALLTLDGVWGLHGWQFLFVVEAIPALVLAVVVARMLPNGPAQAPWLSPAEASAVEARIADERQVTESGVQHGWGRALLGPQSLLTFAVYFCHQIAIYSVNFFLPGIIGGWSTHGPLMIGSLTALPWAASAAGAVLMLRRRRSTRANRRILVGGLLVMAAGLTIGTVHMPVLALGGFCIAAFMFFAVQAIIFTYPAARLRGVHLAAGIALTNSIGLLGGFLGPTLMGLVESRTGSTHDGLLAIAVLLAIAALLATQLRAPEPDTVSATRTASPD